MATPSQYTALLGYDPREDELARRKLWAGSYASAQSPWERVGLGISQLGGALFDRVMGEDSEDPLAQATKISTEASQQFTPYSAEYYKYIAENVKSPMIQQNAYGLYQKAFEKETTQAREQNKYLKENPEQLAAELEPLTARLENRAKLLYAKEGYDPASGEPVPENIMKRLEKTPEYRKILQLSNAGSVALMDQAQKEEKENLGITSAKLGITKLQQDIANVGKSDQAASDFLSTYGLDVNKNILEQMNNIPALSQAQYIPGFVNNLLTAQKKALEKKKPAVIKLN